MPCGCFAAALRPSNAVGFISLLHENQKVGEKSRSRSTKSKSTRASYAALGASFTAATGC
eukprot:4346670-Pleurochrysis_carterae.AAC.4